jgi:hypothetical protein
MNRAAPEESRGGPINYSDADFKPNALRQSLVWSYTGVCVSLSAYRGAAVLFKLLDVLVAAAQPVPRLVGGFCCAPGFNAHGAERNGGTVIEWCAHCLAIALPDLSSGGGV